MQVDPNILVFGDLNYTNPNCPKEDAEMQTLVNQIKKKYPDLLFTHIKNEGKRTKQQIDFDRSMGFLNGVSDLVFFGNPCLLLELKRQDHKMSRWQPNQQQFLLNAQKQGCMSCVCFGWVAGMEALENWLKVKK